MPTARHGLASIVIDNHFDVIEGSPHLGCSKTDLNEYSISVIGTSVALSRFDDLIVLFQDRTR
jgi:hypothetical protein